MVTHQKRYVSKLQRSSLPLWGHYGKRIFFLALVASFFLTPHFSKLSASADTTDKNGFICKRLSFLQRIKEINKSLFFKRGILGEFPLFLCFACAIPQKETEQVGTTCPYGDIMVGFSNIIDLEKQHKMHIIAPEKRIILYVIALLKINIY